MGIITRRMPRKGAFARWGLASLLLPLFFLSIPGQLKAQWTIEWRSPGGPVPDASVNDAICRGSQTPRLDFYIVFNGTKADLVRDLGAGAGGFHYQAAVDGVDVPCRRADYCSIGYADPSGAWDSPPQGGYRYQTRGISLFREDSPNAFRSGSHSVSVKVEEVPASGSVSFQINCPGDEGPAQPPPPPAQPALGDVRIAAEKNPVTGDGYTGLVADGVTRLRFLVQIPGASQAQVEVDVGFFEDTEGNRLNDGSIPLNAAGSDTIVYVPPSYLDKFLPSQERELDRSTMAVGNDGLVSYTEPKVVPVELRFTYAAPNGESGERKGTLSLLRTPILFVHGYQGDANTWSEFLFSMIAGGYHGRADDYYARDVGGNQSVAAQASFLHSVVQDEIGIYAKNGIKVSRFDLVSHSMGGLICRQYVEESPFYTGNVRKVITIATPHHGIIQTQRNAAGWVAGWWTGKHRQMKEDVHFQSGFLAKLNAREGVGLQLNPDVQYANMYVVPDDWVVSSRSARLNAVEERPFTDNLTHSSSISGGRGPIMEWDPAVNQVVEWLGRDLRRQPLTTIRAEVMPVSGAVSISRFDPNATDLSEIEEPVPMDGVGVVSGETVRTGSGKALVRYLLNDQVMARISLAPGSEIRIGPFFTDAIELAMVKGKGHFQAMKNPGVPDPSFNLILAPSLYGPKDYDLETPVVLETFGTEFEVTMMPENYRVQLLEGGLEVTDGRQPAPNPVRMSPGEALVLNPMAPPQPTQFVEDRWWDQVSVDLGGPPAQPMVQPPSGSGPPVDAYPPGSSVPPPTLESIGAEGIYLVDTYTRDLNALQGAITSRMNAGYVPMGLSLRPGKTDVLYLGSDVLPVSEWTMDGHNSTDELGTGLTARMNGGYLPTGLGWAEGTYWVLYVKTQITGTAWQIVVSDVNLDAVQRDLAPWLQQGFIPFDVTLAEGRYVTLLVNLSETLAQQWSLQGTLPGGIQELIETQMVSGFFPWGLLYDDVVNVLFLAF